MKKILIGAYIVVGIVTFGHAWNRDFSKGWDPSVNILVAPASAALWPLYWSEYFWKCEEGK